jgi:hypothetical protein
MSYMTSTEFPKITAVQSISSTTVHAGKAGKARGSIVTACNGRTISMGFTFDTDVEDITCKRCHNAITV